MAFCMQENVEELFASKRKHFFELKVMYTVIDKVGSPHLIKSIQSTAPILVQRTVPAMFLFLNEKCIRLYSF